MEYKEFKEKAIRLGYSEKTILEFKKMIEDNGIKDFDYNDVPLYRMHYNEKS